MYSPEEIRLKPTLTVCGIDCACIPSNKCTHYAIAPLPNKDYISSQINAGELDLLYFCIPNTIQILDVKGHGFILVSADGVVWR